MKKMLLSLSVLLSFLPPLFAHAEAPTMRSSTGDSILYGARVLEALRQNGSDLLGNAKGVLVVGVVVGSQADSAGIRVGDAGKREAGDVVVSYAGEPIDTAAALISTIAKHSPTGGEKEMVVIRDNARLVTKLKCGKVGVQVLNVVSLDGVSPPGGGSETAAPEGKPQIFAQLGQLAGQFQFSPLVISPDGRLALSGSGNAVRLWDLASGKEIRTFTGHVGKVTSVAFSPNGRFVLSGCWDGTWKLWDLATGRVVQERKAHDETGVSVAFSPDGRQALTSGGSLAIALWDLATGTLVRAFTDPGGQSADGNKFYMGRLVSVAFSPDGRQALSAASYGAPGFLGLNMRHALKLWDVATGQVLRTMEDHSGHIFSISFSADGRQALSGSEDKEIKLWDLASGKVMRTLKGHASPINTVAFTPDGKHAFSAGNTDGVRLWDLTSGKVVRKIDGIADHAAFSPDGRQALTVNAEAMHLWDADTGTQVHRFLGNSVGYNLSPDGGRLAMAGGISTEIWDFTTGSRKVRSIEGMVGVGDNATSLTFSPDGRTILTSHLDTTLRLRDAYTGKLIRRFEGHSWYVDSVVFSRDGKRALSMSSMLRLKFEGELRLWDVETGKTIRKLTVPDGVKVNAVALSPDGKKALSAADSMVGVTLWDLESGTAIRSFPGFASAVAFSPDGRYAVAAQFEGPSEMYLTLLDLDSGQELRRFKGHSNLIRAVAFSPDGKLALSGSMDNTMKMWDVVTGKEIRTFTGYSAEVSSVSFSADGRLALSGSLDSSARVWETDSGKEVVKMIRFDDGEWITVTPDGYYNASPGGDKYLNVRVGNRVYGIDNYREAFFRPDLVKVALAGGSLKGYRNIAQVKTPPQVEIVDTPLTVAGDELEITLKLSDTGGGIGDVRIYLDGSAVMTDNTRGLKVVAKESQPTATRGYKIRLARGENVIRAVAFNADNSMQSNPAEQIVTASFTPSSKPTLHALVIGINEYKNPKLRLQYAVPDAELFGETLKRGATDLFGRLNLVRLTTPEQTTSENISNELKKMRSINPEDLFILFVASHGTVDDGEYFLITSNVGSTSTAKLRTDALSQDTLKEMIANIPATKKVIMLDTCNAGQLGEAIQVALLTRGMSEDTAFKILSRAVGSTVLSSATSTQEALEGYQGHGLFTWVLAQGMMGKADKGKSGYVKTTDLVDYVENEVPEIAENHFKRKQYPTTSVSGQGFPIGRVGL